MGQACLVPEELGDMAQNADIGFESVCDICLRPKDEDRRRTRKQASPSSGCSGPDGGWCPEHWSSELREKDFHIDGRVAL